MLAGSHNDFTEYTTWLVLSALTGEHKPTGHLFIIVQYYTPGSIYWCVFTMFIGIRPNEETACS